MNIFILYNTEQDHFGSGEKSRFISQLEMMKKDISHKIITPKVISKPIKLKEILKNSAIQERLIELAAKGISPSTITSYLYNPIQFYKQKVLKIKEFNDKVRAWQIATMDQNKEKLAAATITATIEIDIPEKPEGADENWQLQYYLNH